MKHLFYQLLILLPWVASAQKATNVASAQKATNKVGRFYITARLDGAGDLRYANKAILVYPGGEHSDTVLIRNNRFKFEGTPSGDFQRATLYLQYTNLDSIRNRTIWSQDARTFPLESGKIEMYISCNVKDAVVKAGEQNRVWSAYLQLTQPIQRAIDSLRSKQSTLDSSAYKGQMKALRAALTQAEKQFIRTYPHHNHSLELLNSLVRDYWTRHWVNDTSDTGLMEYLELYKMLSPRLQKEGSYIYTQLENSRQRSIIPFSGETPDGKILDVNSLKGKVFLIDFWGSWCIWCRKGHPHLKELYAKYKDHGFEILGVGHEFFEKTRDGQWRLFKEAIRKDGITWPQILNDPAKNDLTKVYMVSAYPTKILVDRNGKILLRVTDDSERRIDAKLKELFGF